MSWLEIFKNVILKCCLLLFYATVKHFSIGLWCAMKSGFYITTGDDQLSSWTKKRLQSISQSQICTTERSRSLFGGVWFTKAFWILAKPLYLRSMLSKLMRCTKNWNTYTWHWSIERAQLFSILPTCSTTSTSEVEQIGLCSFASFAILTWTRQLTTTSSSISTTFCWGKCLHNQQEAENAF